MKDNFFNLIFITIIIIGMIWYHDNYIMPFQSKKQKIKNKIINKHVDVEEVNRVYQESDYNKKHNDKSNKNQLNHVNQEVFSDDLGSLINSDSGFSLGKLESDNNKGDFIDDNSLFDNKSFDSKFSDDY